MKPDSLFQSITLGATPLANRICMAAHRTNLARGGRIGARLRAYYQRRARGGCGAIIVGELCIHPQDRPHAAMIHAFDPGVIPGYQALTRSLRDHGAAGFALLNHHGFQSSGAISRHAVWGPSAVADVAFGETAMAMEDVHMAEVTEAFANAATLARDGGFDGVVVDMGPESLLRQFLSPISNHRPDGYGGSPDHRLRFPLAVVQAVRRAVGNDYTLGVRLCGDENFYGGIDADTSLAMAKTLESQGPVDFFNVAVATYYNLYLVQPTMHTPQGFTAELTAGIKTGVSCPVMAGSQIGTPGLAREILDNGQADLVGMVRPLICDPDLPRKTREGREDQIRYCARDNGGCVARINQSKPLSCVQNPEVGAEAAPDAAPLPVDTPKTVWVVGAGPAGLAAARSAAARGHRVAVYEKEPSIGGQVSLACRGAGRGDIYGVIENLSRDIAALGVPIHTATPVDARMVHENPPDALVLATGSRPVDRPLPGDYGPPAVLNVWDVLRERYPVGENVLFIDENGGHHATATAELLADQGRQVTLVTSALFIGQALCAGGDLYFTRQRLLQKRVVFRPDIRTETIEGRTVTGREVFTNQPVRFEDFDTIVLDVGQAADEALYFELKGRVRELHRCGDCVAPRNIAMAIWEGRNVGERI